MQFAVWVIEFAITLPRLTAAKAIAAPTIARMSAYSAAEAPDSSFSIRMKVFIIHSFHIDPRPPVDTDFLLDRSREVALNSRHRPGWNRVKRPVA